MLFDEHKDIRENNFLKNNKRSIELKKKDLFVTLKFPY